MTETITLYNLPKISLNKSYASEHWTKRKALKDRYFWIIKSQTKKIFDNSKRYQVKYTFNFKTKPLDCTNLAYAAKMIEDVLFEDDSYKVVTSVTLESKKSIDEFVLIEIKC